MPPLVFLPNLPTCAMEFLNWKKHYSDHKTMKNVLKPINNSIIANHILWSTLHTQIRFILTLGYTETSEGWIKIPFCGSILFLKDPFKNYFMCEMAVMSFFILLPVKKNPLCQAERDRVTKMFSFFKKKKKMCQNAWLTLWKKYTKQYFFGKMTSATPKQENATFKIPQQQHCAYTHCVSPLFSTEDVLELSILTLWQIDALLVY